MRRFWFPAMAVGAGAVAFMVMTPASAVAANVLTLGSVGGANVAVGDTIAASLKAGTTANFRSTSGGSTGVTCSVSSFSGTVTTNPPAPGTATGSLTAQSFSSCVENILGVISVLSVTVDGLPYTVSQTSGGGVTISKSGGSVQTTIRLSTILGTVTCVYRKTTLSGTSSNADNSINFVNQQFTKFSGPGLCFTNGFFTASYAPVRDTSQPGSPAVFVN